MKRIILILFLLLFISSYGVTQEVYKNIAVSSSIKYDNNEILLKYLSRLNFNGEYFFSKTKQNLSLKKEEKYKKKFIKAWEKIEEENKKTRTKRKINYGTQPHNIRVYLNKKIQENTSTFSFNSILGNLYKLSAHVSQGYLIEEHTYIVLDIFDKQWNFFLKNIKKQYENFDEKKWYKFFKIVLALHDIGKGFECFYLGIKNDSHIVTKSVIEQIMPDLGFSDSEIALASALVSHDYLGQCFKGDISAGKAWHGIKKIVSEHDIKDLNLFFEFLKLYYTCDSASYSNIRKVVFKTYDYSMQLDIEKVGAYKLLKKEIERDRFEVSLKEIKSKMDKNLLWFINEKELYYEYFYKNESDGQFYYGFYEKGKLEKGIITIKDEVSQKGLDFLEIEDIPLTVKHYLLLEYLKEYKNIDIDILLNRLKNIKFNTALGKEILNIIINKKGNNINKEFAEKLFLNFENFGVDMNNEENFKFLLDIIAKIAPFYYPEYSKDFFKKLGINLNEKDYDHLNKNKFKMCKIIILFENKDKDTYFLNLKYDSLCGIDSDDYDKCGKSSLICIIKYMFRIDIDKKNKAWLTLMLIDNYYKSKEDIDVKAVIKKIRDNLNKYPLMGNDFGIIKYEDRMLDIIKFCKGKFAYENNEWSANKFQQISKCFKDDKKNIIKIAEYMLTTDNETRHFGKVLNIDNKEDKEKLMEINRYFILRWSKNALKMFKQNVGIWFGFKQNNDIKEEKYSKEKAEIMSYLLAYNPYYYFDLRKSGILKSVLEKLPILSYIDKYIKLAEKDIIRKHNYLLILRLFAKITGQEFFKEFQDLFEKEEINFSLIFSSMAEKILLKYKVLIKQDILDKNDKQKIKEIEELMYEMIALQRFCPLSGSESKEFLKLYHSRLFINKDKKTYIKDLVWFHGGSSGVFTFMKKIKQLPGLVSKGILEDIYGVCPLGGELKNGAVKFIGDAFGVNYRKISGTDQKNFETAIDYSLNKGYNIGFSSEKKYKELNDILEFFKSWIGLFDIERLRTLCMQLAVMDKEWDNEKIKYIEKINELLIKKLEIEIEIETKRGLKELLNVIKTFKAPFEVDEQFKEDINNQYPVVFASSKINIDICGTTRCLAGGEIVVLGEVPLKHIDYVFTTYKNIERLKKDIKDIGYEGKIKVMDFDSLRIGMNNKVNDIEFMDLDKNDASKAA